MVDELMVVCVDRIIASAACLQQPNNTTPEKESVAVSVGGGNDGDGTTKDGIFNGGISSSSSTEVKGRVSECRICQEEDHDKDLESPCACSGTLKFAHRKCVQRWCNKKGDITCEICNQVFSPNYICPPPRGNADVMTIDIRQAWEAHVDLHHTQLLAFTEAGHQLLQSEYNDYGMENRRILICFRSAVIILMLLLVIHQTLMVKLDIGMPLGSSVFFHLAGFLLPCYIVAHSWYIVQYRRGRQG
ncbi:uncharacterized protein LOC130997470 isoform X2 [Salvia miltiorrhiza]|uniref:uncharacterized protein LOC130996754 isoform X2 n=1 Tax=Salvia miltiorrhiza TaxID=226208 RepID=UPI0025AD2007|nr:uncharacterized protein LOC130996754 isoform X2 [Salvia miltiorrhiza]XP_057778777.1 uncharacterized protein LOC130997470 isoform X2 [Salvia miltiorrhiza]